MKRYPLVGFKSALVPARVASEVTFFEDAPSNGVFRIELDKDPSCIHLHTKKDSYQLAKHSQLNIYMGVCNGHKVHVSLKKVVGELRYW